MDHGIDGLVPGHPGDFRESRPMGEGSGSSIQFFLADVVMPALLLVVSACWMIFGYVVTDDMLLVQRLSWQSKMDLKELVSVGVDPEAMARSPRTLGVGELF